MSIATCSTLLFRPGELRRAEWDEFDFEKRRMARIPAGENENA
jgi:integrase